MRLLGRWNWWLPRSLERFLAARLPLIGGAILVVALVLAGCSPAGRVLGVDPQPRPSPAPASPTAVAAGDPRPIAFPADESPHHRLTEWWYDTGHLASADGHRFGFEFVVFRAERGDFPVSWAAHLALTDETGAMFRYDQRTFIGPAVDRSDRKSTRLNSSHIQKSRMPSSA